MDNMLQKIIDFIKKETVLTIATVLAVVSAFWVHPGRQYVDYIDWRVLGILLSLMLIVAGFQSNGLFDAIGSRLLAKTKNTAQLMLVLVFLCFFSSMFITNDVALLTFVPFACTILQKCHQERLIVTAFVLQTLAANLGSMLTPIGIRSCQVCFCCLSCSCSARASAGSRWRRGHFCRRPGQPAGRKTGFIWRSLC